MDEDESIMNHVVNKNQELSILIYSCWKNSDMWDVFMKLFSKYWPDCIYQTVLLTDRVDNIEEKYGFDEVVVLDGTWKEMLFAGMDMVHTKYVMLWMDDYLLCDYVKNEDIHFYIDVARKYNAANIRLIESPSIAAKTFEKDGNFNCYKAGTAYSFSTQVGIWDVVLLKKYIKNYQTPWDFERKGSVEIKDNRHPLLAPKNYTFPYEEGVRRGKWMDNGVRLCRRNNISLDFNKRKQMSSFELAWIYFKGGILEISPTKIVKIQNFFDTIQAYIMNGRKKKRI